MALLHMLKSAARSVGFSLSAVNCEHGIRGRTSVEDSRFVEEICRKWEIPLYSFSADCPAEAETEKVSLETAARNFRYRVFESLLRDGKADCIATAHHLGDESETVLFRLCRGASLSGAKGIAERDGFIRPLLGISKAQIFEYAKKNGVPFREDESNLHRDFTRNKLRLDVLPLLEETVSGASGNLARFARIAAEDDELLYELSADLIQREPPAFAGDTGFRVLFSDKPPLFRRACLSVLKALGVEKDYTFRHLESICGLKKLQTGSRSSLPCGLEARRIYDKIYFCRTEAEKPFFGTEKFKIGVLTAGRYEITVSESVPTSEEKTGVFGRVLALDRDSVPNGALFRVKREGDWFEKFGGGRKSLKKYLVDRKINCALRAELPVLADGNGNEIYAVCGIEIADRVKLTDGTVCPLYITIKKKQEGLYK